MRKSIFICSAFSLLSICYGLTLPKGWREVTVADVQKYSTVKFNPTFYKLAADFDGNGVEDEARILINDSGNTGLFVFLKDKSGKLKEYSLGVDQLSRPDLIVRPNLNFKLASKGSVWSHECEGEDEGPREVKLENVGLQVDWGDEGGDGPGVGPSVYYWNKASGNFSELVTC